MTPALYDACEKSIHVMRNDGTLVRGGRAVLFITHALGWRRSSWILSQPPFIWGVEFAYALVSANRSFFGRYLLRKD